MNKKIKLSLFLLCGSLYLLSAGDVFHFINLGFSRDSKVFSFVQYGVNDTDNTTSAEFYFIDVVRNSYLKDGVKKQNNEIIPNPGQSAEGIVFNGIRNNSEKFKSLSIDHMNTGRLLFVSLKDNKQHLEFRDFETDQLYTIDLLKNKKTVSSSFYINMSRKKSEGKIEKYLVGNPSVWRTGVTDYQLDSILISPDEKSLVFVLAKIYSGKENETKVRFMVETVKLK